MPREAAGVFLEFCFMPSLRDIARDGVLCTFGIQEHQQQQLALPEAHSWAAPDQGKRYSTVHQVKAACMDWVTLLQPARRAAMLDRPSRLRHHCSCLPLMIWVFWVRVLYCIIAVTGIARNSQLSRGKEKSLPPSWQDDGPRQHSIVLGFIVTSAECSGFSFFRLSGGCFYFSINTSCRMSNVYSSMTFLYVQYGLLINVPSRLVCIVRMLRKILLLLNILQGLSVETSFE